MSKFLDSIVVGIDVSADFSIATILAPDGAMYRKGFRFENDSEGFSILVESIKKAEETYRKDAVVFMESTGTYHLSLFYYLSKQGITIYTINPLITHASKNKGIRKVKSDKSDSYTIAQLGKYQTIKTSRVIQVPVYELRLLCREYYDLIDIRANIKTQISNVLHTYFPGYGNVFSNTTGKTSLAILRLYPCPKNIIPKNEEKIKELMKNVSKRHMPWINSTYQKLVNAAQNASEIQFLNSSSKLKRLIDSYDFYTKQLEQLESEINKYATSDKLSSRFKEGIELIDSIPGVGFLQSVALMTEIGDITDFKKPKHLVAYFGLDPSVNQSGKYLSTHNHISKRGSRIARKVLYQISLLCIRDKNNGIPYNPILKEFYTKVSTRKPRKVAQVAVMSKLTKYIFSILTAEKPYHFIFPKDHNAQYFVNYKKIS